METQTQRTGVWTHRGKQRVRRIERVAWTNVHYMWTTGMWGTLLGDTRISSVTTLRGEVGVGGKLMREGIYVY